MTDPFADPDLVACARIVEAGDPDRFAAVMAAPLAARVRLFPLYAFNVEVARAPWVTQEPVIAEMRLQWWRDVLDEIAAGGMVRRHEVATPLARVLDADGARLLDALIAARRSDLEREMHADGAALEAYIAATGGGMMRAAARVLGDRDGQAAAALGFASGMAAYLEAVPALEARGRLPLPDGREDAVRALARAGLARLEEARALRARVPARAKPALLAGWKAAPLLRRAAAQPRLVAQGGLTQAESTLRVRRLWVGLTGRW